MGMPGWVLVEHFGLLVISKRHERQLRPPLPLSSTDSCSITPGPLTMMLIMLTRMMTQRITTESLIWRSVTDVWENGETTQGLPPHHRRPKEGHSDYRHHHHHLFNSNGVSHIAWTRGNIRNHHNACRFQNFPPNLGNRLSPAAWQVSVMWCWWKQKIYLQQTSV